MSSILPDGSDSKTSPPPEFCGSLADRDKAARAIVAGDRTGTASGLIAAVAAAIADERRRARKPFEDLFSGGPDTACRTTWPDGVECCEVPMTDLRAAFDGDV